MPPAHKAAIMVGPVLKVNERKAACCDGKHPFVSFDLAKSVADRRHNGKLKVYRCSVCFQFHIGNSDRRDEVRNNPLGLLRTEPVAQDTDLTPTEPAPVGSTDELIAALRAEIRTLDAALAGAETNAERRALGARFHSAGLQLNALYKTNAQERAEKLRVIRGLPENYPNSFVAVARDLLPRETFNLISQETHKRVKEQANGQ